MEYARVSLCLNEMDGDLTKLASLLAVLLEQVGQIGDRVDPGQAAAIAADLTAIAHDRVVLALGRLGQLTMLAARAA